MDKDALRAEILGYNKPTEDISSQTVRGLRDWLAVRLPGTVGAYLAMDSEIDVEPLFEALPGWRWVLVRLEPDRETTFRDRGVPLETHKFGMRQPVDAGEVVHPNEIDFYLVPGVAFDLSGGRLGHGSGYYDRILARRRPDAVAIGVTTEVKVVSSVPMDPHDQYVQFVATEAGVKECSPTRSHWRSEG